MRGSMNSTTIARMPNRQSVPRLSIVRPYLLDVEADRAVRVAVHEQLGFVFPGVEARAFDWLEQEVRAGVDIVVVGGELLRVLNRFAVGVQPHEQRGACRNIAIFCDDIDRVAGGEAV